jgi:hypothetical protein
MARPSRDKSWRDWTPPPGSRSTPAGASPQLPAAPARPPGWNKFHAEKTIARDGTTLDSSHEARVYQDLLFRERAGEIRDLQRQVPIRLVAYEKYLTTIKVDFVFQDVKTGRLVYLEAKSPVTRTRLYVLTRKIFAAQFGVEVEEA